GEAVCVCIGPEGDFSETEVNAASALGFAPISLGLPRYRTETAAVVAGTLFNHFNVTLL
ncbi:MAG: 16S rRNA (uracil1498-N3)-methyltransferase, partial [Bacteroidia bacterium]